MRGGGFLVHPTMDPGTRPARSVLHGAQPGGGGARESIASIQGVQLNMLSVRALFSCALLSGTSLGCEVSSHVPPPEQHELAGVAQVGDQRINQAMLDLWTEHNETRISALVGDTLLALESKATQPHRAAVI